MGDFSNRDGNHKLKSGAPAAPSVLLRGGIIDDPVGDRYQVKLGRYEVVRELGKGAMGIVYLAKDPLIGRLVALKTIRAQNQDDDEAKEFQQRFVREAQAAGILNHPSIVTVHDIGQDDTTGTSFIAMEYVEGQNLKEVLSQGRPLGFEQIGEIVAQVADALDFAHAKGIVHRDVKPANIILLDGLRAKITDFGIAKITSGGNLTTTGQFLGTPNYMAPEQIKGAPVDGRTDIFSLGICLYECLTRRKPFGGDSLTSISYKIVHEAFPPLHDINPQIPDGYDEIVGHCLAKDPSKRFQRGKDLAAALRQVMRGERPVRAEQVLEDITVVTRPGDREKLPTIEVPFPEAGTPPPAPEPLDTNPQSRPAAAAAAVPPKPARPRIPAKEMLRQTFTGIRKHPALGRKLPPVLFFAVVGVLVAMTLGAVVLIKSRFAPPATVDRTVEQRRARERVLRFEADQLLKQGRARDAYNKYLELQKLAPQSTYVADRLQRLSLVLQKEETGKQKLLLAKQRFDEGLALFTAKKYAESIPLFSESFSINPSSEETANYLKLAQQEDQREKAARQRTQQQKVAQQKTTTAATGTLPRPVPVPMPTGPTSLTTVFNSPVNDGYIVVKAGIDVLAHENLWVETGRAIFRRKVPRKINVTKEFPPKNADLEVWVVIKSLNVNEHKIIPRINFIAGVNHRLTVNFNPASKTFEYSLN
jgi:serine/threonine protein kinase